MSLGTDWAQRSICPALFEVCKLHPSHDLSHLPLLPCSQIARSEKTGRDALCTPEDPSPLRAHAPARPVRRPRRVPPRRHRAEPQDTGAAPPPAATTARLRVSCVASVGGVSVEAEARMGEARNPDQPYTC